MNVVGAIIVRMKSERLSRKALLEIQGRPLIEHLILNVRRAKSLSQLVICTSSNNDDDVLEEIGDRLGVRVVRGHETDIVSRLLTAANLCNADNVVRITGDNPLTNPVVLDKLVIEQCRHSSDYTRTNVLPLGVAPDIYSVELLKDLSRNAEIREKSEYLSFFAFAPDRYKCLLVEAEDRCRYDDYSLTVDYPRDLERVSMVFGALSFDEYNDPNILCEFVSKHATTFSHTVGGTVKLPNGRIVQYEDYIKEFEMISQDSRVMRSFVVSW
jgi:spore coat polysaccharide biosynthesis protein SpsF